MFPLTVEKITVVSTQPLFAEIIADPLLLVSLYQFPLAKETIL